MKFLAFAAAMAVTAAGGLIFVQTQSGESQVAAVDTPSVDPGAAVLATAVQNVPTPEQPVMSANAQEVAPLAQTEVEPATPDTTADAAAEPSEQTEQDLPLFVATVGRAEVFVATVMAGMATNFFGAVSGKCGDGSCPLRD